MAITLVVGLVSALVAAWLVLTVLLLVASPSGQGVRSIAGFFPNVVHLLRDLYRDPAVPRAVRLRLWVAILYNVQPFTLIPDFVPVVGFADNLVVTAWALRSAVHGAGGSSVVRHWRGSASQLGLLFRVARLGSVPDVHEERAGTDPDDATTQPAAGRSPPNLAPGDPEGPGDPEVPGDPEGPG